MPWLQDANISDRRHRYARNEASAAVLVPGYFYSFQWGLLFRQPIVKDVTIELPDSPENASPPSLRHAARKTFIEVLSGSRDAGQ
jgi:hypothetical protein